MKFEPLQPCPRCNKIVQVEETLCEDGPHFSQLRCPECKHFFGFRAKPKNDDKLEHRPNGCPSPKDLNIDYCQICLNEKDYVHKQYLETHHIDNNPSNNDRLNLLVVCRACHRLIHWTRTYLNDK